jgi:hypothetical protein
VSKYFLILVGCLVFFGNFAQANDTGIVAVDVDSISTLSDTGLMRITFSGKEVNNFMKLIPGVEVTGDPSYGNDHKSILFIKGREKVDISCDRREEEDSNRRITPVCSIFYEKVPPQFDVVGTDTSPLNPYAIAKKILGIK